MKNLSHQRLLRKLLLFVLTLSTVVALSVAVPAGAEGEGGVIYLNFKNTGIEAVTPTLSGEAGYIPSETMEYDEDLGLYWCAVSADVLTVRFYVDFLDDREDISTASIDVVGHVGMVYDVATAAWYAVGSQPESSVPDDTTPETPETPEPPDAIEPDLPITDGSSANGYSGLQDNTSATITPSGKVNGSSDATDVVSVDLNWEAMEFTYTPASRGEWNPYDHTYEGGAEATWTSTTNEITVTNHSNAEITAAFSFESVASLDLAGEFHDENGEVIEEITLASAENAQGGVGAATVGTVTFHIVRGAIQQDTDALGEITVRISK